MNMRNYLVGMFLCIAAILLSASSASAQITVPQIYDFEGTIELPFVVEQYQGLPLIVESERDGGILTVHQLDGRETEIDEYVGQGYWAFVMYNAETEEAHVAIATIHRSRTLRELYSIIEIVEDGGGWFMGAKENPEPSVYSHFGALTSTASLDWIQEYTESHLLMVSLADGGESVMQYLETGSRAIQLEAVYVADGVGLVIDDRAPLVVPGNF